MCGKLGGERTTRGMIGAINLLFIQCEGNKASLNPRGRSCLLYFITKIGGIMVIKICL